MKLDKRILEGKKPLFCLDTEEAKQFIGKEGYFTNHLGVFAHIRRIEKYMLTAIDEKAQSCFKDVDGVRWDWFLPTEWVKPEEPEKKYRPYTLDEFVNTYSLGDEVIMKSKNSPTVTHVLFVGYEEGEDDVRLGQCWYTFMTLFNNYEIYTGKGWKPFGIEV